MDQQAEQLHSGAKSLVAKFAQEGSIRHIDEALVLDRQALAVYPPDHPKWFDFLTCLADHLYTRYDQLGSIEVNEVIVLDREALARRPPGHPDCYVSLIRLAGHLYTRYKRLGSVEELNEAIVHDRDALALCTPEHSGRPSCLNNLALHLTHRYKHSKSVADLNEAVVLSRDALALCPPGHPDRLASLYSLSRCLGNRSNYLESVDDLNEAIVLAQDALVLCPLGHPESPVTLNSLAVRVYARYMRFGSMDDLNRAIVLMQDTLTIRPPGHPDRPCSLSDLAAALFARYRQLGTADDLNGSIVADRDALALRTPGDPDRPHSLNNLAEGLCTRFNQLGSADDLNEAILLNREALTLCPPGHPDRSCVLNNLAVDLFARYNKLGSVDDLDETIILDQEALALNPLGHPDRSTSLNNLADHLYTRYNQLGSVEDLNEAIFLDRDALALRPLGHRGRSQSLSNLAQHLSVRCTSLGLLKDKEEIFIQLACAPPMTSSADLSAARAWIRAAEDYQHPSRILAYKTSLRFLAHHAASLPSLPRHLTVLKHLVSSLAMDAFSASLRNYSLTDAVELLEQGRGVFWTQLTRLHSPIQNLSTSGPEGKILADEFIHFTTLVRKALNSPGPNQHDRVCNLNVQLHKVVSTIRDLPGFKCFLLPSPFSDLKLAAEGGPVIIVNASEHGCDALVVLFNHDPIHIPLSVTKEGVRELSSRLATLTVRAKSMDITKHLCTFLRGLWDMVVSPIVDFLQTICPSRSRIWWCPTAEFSLLPLHAAGPYRKGQLNLPELYTSSYTPTLTALIHARRRHLSSSPSQPKRFIAIGQANAAGENELFSVGAELITISRRVGSVAAFTSTEGEESSIARVTGELHTNEWVHFACHGIPNRNRPFESAFALHDGHFTIEQIIRCELGDPEFAYLSACHTTVGDKESPDEVIHLASAMQFIGFRSVIGTMWAVDDECTNRITSMFYDDMKDETGCLDYTRAASALNKTMRILVDIPFDQRVLYIHLGA